MHRSETVYHTMKSHISDKNTASLTLNGYSANVSLGIMPHIRAMVWMKNLLCPHKKGEAI